MFLNIKSRNEKASLLLAEIQTESIREAKLKSLKNTVFDTEGLRQELDKYVLGSDDVVLLIEQIEGFGSELGAISSIRRVELKPFGESESFEWLSLALSTDGSWSQVVNFVSIAELLPYRTATESLTINKETTDGVVSWQSNMVLNVLKKK